MTVAFKGVLLLFFIFFTVCSNGQVNTVFIEETPLLYRNEASGGIIIHSNGLGGSFRKGKHITGYKKFVYEIELLSMKNPKEIKTTNPYFDNSKSYVYGKLNSLMPLRTGVGFQRTIYSKAERGGIEIRFNYLGGLSLGIAKPVYLDILFPTGVPYEYDYQTLKYDPEEHFIDNIYGKAPFSYGLNELRFYPGAYGKVSVSFEYGNYDDDIKFIETGIALDVYPQEVPIMAFIDNKNIFLSFYINIMYGRKW